VQQGNYDLFWGEEGGCRPRVTILAQRAQRAKSRLTIPFSAAARDVVERVHAIHAMNCPSYRSLYTAIDITTEVKIEEEPG